MASCRSAHVRFIWTLTGMRNLSGTTSLGRRPPGLAVRACLSPPVCGAPAALAHVASQLVVDRSIQKDLEAVFSSGRLVQLHDEVRPNTELSFVSNKDAPYRIARPSANSFRSQMRSMLDSRNIVVVGCSHLLKRCLIKRSIRSFWSWLCRADSCSLYGTRMHMRHRHSNHFPL